nr:MAG TPA: hypothetical protein [Caudoviricetes sp.]
MNVRVINTFISVIICSWIKILRQILQRIYLYQNRISLMRNRKTRQMMI